MCVNHTTFHLKSFPADINYPEVTNKKKLEIGKTTVNTGNKIVICGSYIRSLYFCSIFTNGKKNSNIPMCFAVREFQFITSCSR